MTIFWDTVRTTDKRKETIENLKRLGYNGVIWTTVVKSVEDIPQPPNRVADEEISFSSHQELQFHEKYRVTVVIEDAKTGTQLSNMISSLSGYDIIAVEPASLKALEFACQTLQVDIISIKMSTRLPFILKFSTIGAAIQRGLYFESYYASALRDPTCRRHLTCNFQSLLRSTRGKNIVLASQSKQLIQQRGPFDIVNLFTILGLSQEKGIQALSSNINAVLLHATSRRIYKSTIQVQDCPKDDFSERSSPEKVGN